MAAKVLNALHGGNEIKRDAIEVQRPRGQCHGARTVAHTTATSKIQGPMYGADS